MNPFKKFFPFADGGVKAVAAIQGMLLTLSLKNELAIWDVKDSISTPDGSPKMVSCIENVSCYELKNEAH